MCARRSHLADIIVTLHNPWSKLERNQTLEPCRENRAKVGAGEYAGGVCQVENARLILFAMPFCFAYIVTRANTQR